MAEAHPPKSLTIRRETCESVTTLPHFPVVISYFGHHVAFDDIYLDDPERFLRELQALQRNREGEVRFDGGPRIRIRFRCDSRGGVLIAFRTEQCQPEFSGRCVLEGSFDVAGEHVAELVRSFETLIRDGIPVSL